MQYIRYAQNQKRTQIRDSRVRDLADDIIKAQVRELDEMQRLINDIEQNGVMITR